MNATNLSSDRMLKVAAVLTWGAVLVSEWNFQQGVAGLVFVGCALVFIVSFLLDLRRLSLGWSAALLAQVLAAAGAVWISGSGITPALYVIVGAQLFERLERAQIVAVLIALNAVLLARLLQAAPVVSAFSAFAAFVGFQMFGLLLAQNAIALRRANQQLLASNAELGSTRSLLEESARTQERLHLSRELHDVCGHKLTALKLNLRQHDSSAEPRPLDADKRVQCAALADELLGDIRAVVAQLRTHEDIDLAKALRALAASWPKPEVQLSIEEGLCIPSLACAETLLRIAQEGLTNAARHSQASRVEIALASDGAGIQISIRDNGGRCKTLVPGHGLNGMRERIQALGGSFDISQAGQGVGLLARLPIASGLAA